MYAAYSTIADEQSWIVGDRTGQVTDDVPPPSEETKQSIQDALESSIKPPHLMEPSSSSSTKTANTKDSSTAAKDDNVPENSETQ